MQCWNGHNHFEKIGSVAKPRGGFATLPIFSTRSLRFYMTVGEEMVEGEVVEENEN